MRDYNGNFTRAAERLSVIGWRTVVVSLTLGLVFGWAIGGRIQRLQHSIPFMFASPAFDRSHSGMVWIPGGVFDMGSIDKAARSNEQPVHQVRLHGFWMDKTPVTNAQFERFVAATGYVSTAERRPAWDSLKSQLPPGTPKPPDDVLVPGSMVFIGTSQPVDLDDAAAWWRYVPGADWRHPRGPGSSIADRQDHPVVQVSYDDALAYARWSGKSLPTEAEWEFAARGGLGSSTYAWGNEAEPNGQAMANVWAVTSANGKPFPVVEENHPPPGTTRVCTFPPNGYRLCDMTGNVWQWVSDWYRSDAYAIARTSIAIDPPGPVHSYDADESPAGAPKRVIKGGSFLCSDNYCLSYRPSARRGSDPDSGMSHIGFRLVSREM